MLSLVNNVTSLAAQTNLGKTQQSLSSSLEKLSSGLKINRGADGPAALVISEQQRSQISGLQAAIANTNKAVAVVQTGEGALNEINGLLTKVRSLAVDSANSGVNDANALAANQAEITNALDTINRIANTTKFGSKNLLNGQAGAVGAVSGTNNAVLAGIKAGTAAPAGNNTVLITTQGKGGKVLSTDSGGAAGAGSSAAGGSLVVGGGGLTQALTVGIATGDNAQASALKIQSALDNASSVGGGSGKFTVSAAAGVITIQSNVLGATASPAMTVTADSADTQTVTGFKTAGTTGSAGVDLVATVNGAATAISAGTSGLNNQVTFGGATGLTFSINVTNGVTMTAAGSSTVVNVNDQSLTFQIGANANETAKVSFDKVTADSLGTGVAGSSAADLSKINVTSQTGAQDAIKVVDQAINDVTTLRGRLGAFQANTLQSNAANLQTTLQNTTAAESTIRDTDFATEIANFTRSQTAMQAGATVLGNANQMSSLVAQLLRG